ncbi:Gfo/Idh/MocA family protein [Horticoccus sp. 23ND18S-11]|uniref:Gfo/Idh/MocA family protein n=1 Tax=Horticoccus sp. 23ND18S-11 TaxID=3391832 RepID=UPI0039C91785
MKSNPSQELPRRQFIAQAGLGLAALSTTRLAVAQGSAANSKLRLGVIGCGKRGQWITALFAEHGGYEIAGLADYFPEAVNEAAGKFGVPSARTFTGLKCAEKLIARGKLDAVAIISPPYFHPGQAQAAVAAGMNVYLAKPVAVDVPGCHAITASADTARKQGKVFLVDFQTRTNEFYLEALRRVHAGALGDLCFGEASYHDGRLALKAPPGTPEARLKNWVFDQALSGDIIVEQNIHAIDVMSWVMKDTPPLRCTGTGGRRVRLDAGNAWDHFALTYEYANQIGVTFSSRQFDAHGTPGGILNRMFGSKGVLMTAYGGDVLIRGAGDTFYRGGKTGGIYKEGAVANIRAFHAAVQKQDVTNATVAPSVTSNLVAIMGRTAAYEKRTVTWAELVASKKVLQPELFGLHA